MTTHHFDAEVDESAPIQLQQPLSGTYVVGVDIGGTGLRLAFADADGTIAGKWSTSTLGIRKADEIVRLICEGVEAWLQAHTLSRAALRAIAAGAPGVTNTTDGIVIATSYLMGWRDVPLRTMLEEALDVPAMVDNDVNMAAIGEHWSGAARGIDDFVFLAIGTGIGAGIVLDAKLYRGHAWSAGEVGYMLVPGVSEEPIKRGEPGALEGIAGGEGIGLQWRNSWSEALTPLAMNASATEIFDHALEGNALARQVLEMAAKALAYAIYNLSLVLNCSLFVLGGTVGLHPALGDAIRAVLAGRDDRVKPRIVVSMLGADAQLAGAICAALSLVTSTATAAKSIGPAPANID